MKIIFFLTMTIIELFATNLLTYNIYNRSDRVDIMLSFDAPYDGKISQESVSKSLILKLDNLSYNSIVAKNINSNILQKITLKPSDNFLKIIIISKKQIGVIASKTTDGFGLRIRIKIVNTAKQDKKRATFTQITTKKTKYYNSDKLDYRYISVMIILLMLFTIMFWVKRKFSNNNKTNEKSWLFKKDNSNLKDIKIVYKKPIDSNNSAILLEFESKRYLVISGSSNLLLDIFMDNELQNKNEFEKAFEENRKKLDNYLKLQDSKLEDYKEKASSDFELYNA